MMKASMVSSIISVFIWPMIFFLIINFGIEQFNVNRYIQEWELKLLLVIITYAVTALVCFFTKKATKTLNTARQFTIAFAASLLLIIVFSAVLSGTKEEWPAAVLLCMTLYLISEFFVSRLWGASSHDIPQDESDIFRNHFRKRYDLFLDDLSNAEVIQLIEWKSRADVLSARSYTVLILIVCILLFASGFVVFAERIVAFGRWDPLNDLASELNTLHKNYDEDTQRINDLQKQRDDMRKQLLERDIKSSLEGTGALNDPKLLIAVGLTRLGVILISILLVQILIQLYRYNTQLVAFYLAHADLLVMKDFDEARMRNLHVLLWPNLSYGKEPESFIQSMVNKMSESFEKALDKLPIGKA